MNLRTSLLISATTAIACLCLSGSGGECGSSDPPLYNYRTEGRNTQETASPGTLAVTIYPYQQEQERNIGSNGPWEDTAKHGSNIMCCIEGPFPIEGTATLPGYEGTKQDWPDLNCTVSILLEE